MNILAIETTERIGSVAAMRDGQIICERSLDDSQRSAQSLAPAVKALWVEVGWQPQDVDLVAVTVGPGSFTGLRVGIATAKTLAFCCGAEILGIDTLETIAAAAPSDVERLEVAIDAQRNEVVMQKFHRGSDGRFEPDQDPARLVDIDDWLENLQSGTVISGPILKKLANRLPKSVTPLPPEQSRPTAANIARLAACHYADGRRDDVWKLVPVYSRQSAAEEKWAEKTANGKIE
ncbi:MAG: tRNA (adenosine(37)-N6)-threonylcarbamoyltransferase complex dimerization subunit type 1 TsaB [Planctomycetota bacterium]|nr:tRNA (adenosine(37)-N6)-threonylcarbamoyltransferase complex dimerization subunit type 1 TsaB [Planctomycetota bacterium]